MKKHLRIITGLLTICVFSFIGSFSVMAEENIAYVAATDDSTLTFYYDDNYDSFENIWEVGDGYIDNDNPENGIKWLDYTSVVTKVVFDDSFADYKDITSTSFWFSGFTDLEKVEGLINLETAFVTDMSYMFYECTSLQNIDISLFNTASVLNFTSMFEECTMLETIYASDDFIINADSATDNMFLNCLSLNGANGTCYADDNSAIDGVYACIDREGQQGYFSETDQYVKYISALQFGFAETVDDAIAVAMNDGFSILSGITYEDNPDSNKYPIYLANRSTFNNFNAIRDIIYLDTESIEEGAIYEADNGCTYYPIGAYNALNEWYTVLAYDLDATGNSVYFYYTTDEAAGDPIINVKFTNEIDDSWKTVGYPSKEEVDLNEGEDNIPIYLQYQCETDLSNAGSIFGGSYSWLIISAGCVIILGAIIAAVVIKKKQTADN